MAGRKKESSFQKAAREILKQEDIDFNEWKKDIINKRKLAVMSDEDKEWTERTIDEEAMKLVLDKISSVPSSTNNKYGAQN
ncbi:DUF5415 family protein [Peribacillus sp. R9-11]|uniref:DUF5415 family protein n=1 Tax=Peribacillus sp. R9-11 TaxID=3073271 RepID=UPI002868E502|nr:hypothetical protein [Peribacillus sp. R9-11]WMX58526.1 hypothetical protein RE409_28855 [Peribacillus sp. R9-11]